MPIRKEARTNIPVATASMKNRMLNSFLIGFIPSSDSYKCVGIEEVYQAMFWVICIYPKFPYVNGNRAKNIVIYQLGICVCVLFIWPITPDFGMGVCGYPNAYHILFLFFDFCFHVSSVF